MRGQPWSTTAWSLARAMPQRRAQGWAQLSPFPGAPLLPGCWGSPACFPAHPKEPSPHGALPKRLLRRAWGGHAPPDPSAAGHTSGRGLQPRRRSSPPLPTRWALALPSQGPPVAPCVPQSICREMRALRSSGETCPRSGVAAEVRLATPSLRAQLQRQEEAIRHSDRQTAGRSGGWLTLARGWALPGREGWLLSIARSTVGSGCCWLLSALPQPPRSADLPHAAARVLIRAGGEPRPAARSPGSECLLCPCSWHGKINKRVFLSLGGKSFERRILSLPANTRATTAPFGGRCDCTLGLSFAQPSLGKTGSLAGGGCTVPAEPRPAPRGGTAASWQQRAKESAPLPWPPTAFLLLASIRSLLRIDGQC